MFKVQHLTKTYGHQALFEDVQFHVHDQERVGLVARNGHGKSTLFRILTGMEEPDEGEISFPKDYQIGYLQQHFQFTRSTLIAEACSALPENRAEEKWEVEKILFGLGFTTQDMLRPPQEFSGGFQIRLNLAKVLALDPDLLLLDEPTNYLDILSIRWLREYLREWKKELVLITHDREFMDTVVTHIMGIHRGKIRKIKGTTDKYYSQILAEEEIYEKTRMNEDKKRKEAERFIARFRAKARLAGLVQSRIKALEKQGKKEVLEKIPDLDFEFKADSNPIVMKMEITELSFAYADDAPHLIENLDLTIAEQDRIAVIGPNGRGKSTLLRLLAGELNPSSGRIKCHPRLKTGYYGQTNIAALYPSNTILDELMQADTAVLPQQARNVAGIMMFSGDDALKRVSVLSGGEKSRLLLGKLLLRPVHLLLLDEPTHHLDMESCETLKDAIRSFDGAVVMVTHDEMFLHTMANRFVVFDGGRVFQYHGSYQNFLKDIGWQEEKELAQPTSTVILEAPVHATGNTSKPDNRDLKQARNKILQEKTKLLKPLDTRIKAMELEISQIESTISQNENRLIEAAVKSEKEILATLPKENKILANRRDALYRELEECIRESDHISSVCQAQLTALGKEE